MTVIYNGFLLFSWHSFVLSDIQSFNQALNRLDASGTPVDYSQIHVATYKTKVPKENTRFPACANCCGILPCGVNVITGKINDKAN